MERWVSLFEIFLNCPSPEMDASLWFQQQTNPATSSFLSLLLSPTPSFSSPPTQNPPIFIQTLPLFVQSRILSFLAIEAEKFSRRLLHSLANHILNSGLPSSSGNTSFWVHRAARNLLDAVSSSKNTPSNAIHEDRFHSLPDWLQGDIETATMVLPWLPLSPSELSRTTYCTSKVVTDEHVSDDEVIDQEEVDSCSPICASIDPQISDKANVLKAELSVSISTSEVLRIAHDIRQLCLDAGSGNMLTVLGLIEAWNADDETLAVLLSVLPDDHGLCSTNWPAYVMCSTSLPKLLCSKTPASRVSLSATISFCKLHPVAAVDALLFPLALHKEGISIVTCDVLARVVKECLHPSHVSAFCQKLLCGEGKERRLVCLPCHKELISDELVWTEPMFTLFQHIFNQDVYLTPDTASRLVSVIAEVADKFPKSLKFGNFFLCLVTKCTKVANLYKDMLQSAAKKTDTFVTKSILSKLGG